MSSSGIIDMPHDWQYQRVYPNHCSNTARATSWRISHSGLPVGWRPPTSLGATMSTHRRTQDTVPNNAQLDNFRPTDALESLHAAILRVETIVQIASDAVDRLDCPVNPDRKSTRLNSSHGYTSY